MSAAMSPLPLRANVAWNMGGCLFYLGCQWLTTVLVVALSDGFVEAGDYALAMALGNMFSSVALFKVRAFQVSDLDGAFSSGEYIGFRCVTVAGSLLCCIAHLLIAGADGSPAVCLAYLLFKADEAFSDVLYGMEQVAGRMDLVGKSQAMRGLASVAGFSAGLASGMGLAAAVIGMLAPCALITLAYDARNASRYGIVLPSAPLRRLAALAARCLPAAAANLCAVGVVSIARQRYGAIEGAEMLGVYASIATPAVLVQAAAAYLCAPFITPLAATLRDVGAGGFARRSLGLMAVMTVGGIVLSEVAAATCPPLLMSVFGEGLGGHIGSFRGAIHSALAVAALLYVDDLLVIRRSTRLLPAVNVAAMAVAVSIADRMVYSMGMDGLNLTVCVSAGVGALLGIAGVCKGGTASRTELPG